VKGHQNNVRQFVDLVGQAASRNACP